MGFALFLSALFITIAGFFYWAFFFFILVFGVIAVSIYIIVSSAETTLEGFLRIGIIILILFSVRYLFKKIFSSQD